MFAELIEAMILLPAGAAIGLSLAKRQQPSASAAVCAGYKDHNPYMGMSSDCRSPANPFCADGRCTFHCKEMCKCEHVC